MSKECGSQGGLSQILIEPTGGTFDASSFRIDFVSEDLGLIETQPGGKGLTGRLDPNVEHVRDGPRYVRGRTLWHVSPQEFDFLLPYILRGTEAANVHTPGALSPAVDIMVHRDDATFVYDNLQVNAAMVRSNNNANADEPQLIELMIDWLGYDEAEATYPSPGPDVPNDDVLYWLGADATLTLNSVEYPYEAFNLLISNNLVPLHRNSLLPVCIRSQGRDVRFQPRIPLSDTSQNNLITTKLDGDGSVAFDSTPNLGNGDSSTIFTFDRLRGPRRSPRVRGRSEVWHDLDLIAWAGVDETTNPAIKVTNTFPA